MLCAVEHVEGRLARTAGPGPGSGPGPGRDGAGSAGIGHELGIGPRLGRRREAHQDGQ